MDKETYDALGRVLNLAAGSAMLIPESRHDLWQVAGWMDEVAKDYKGPDATEL